MPLAEVVGREVFVPSPGPGTGVMGGSYYTEREGGRVVSVHSLTTRSDTVDAAFVRTSDDNGRTWSEATRWEMTFAHPDGTGRRHPRGGYVDPATGRYVSVWTEGVLPSDDPLEGMRQWTLRYSVSTDGARTTALNEQIVHEGEQFSEVHHLPGVRRGGNCVMIGDLGQRPLTRSDGVILIPVQSSPAGPDGVYANPGAGFTYTDCLLLMGRWDATEPRLRWTCSERIVGDPARTTRGLIEPTIAELADGTILMVMRGSNDVRPDLPGVKWVSRSADGGQGWSTPAPWTYDDGEAIPSPSACSQLIPWPQPGGDRLLWMGNISRGNPAGNRPRYPLVVGEVDRDTGCLLRDSVVAVDDRAEGESEKLTLSNFYARRDRETGELLVFLPRFFANAGDDGGRADFGTDLSLIRVAID